MPGPCRAWCASLHELPDDNAHGGHLGDPCVLHNIVPQAFLSVDHRHFVAASFLGDIGGGGPRSQAVRADALATASADDALWVKQEVLATLRTADVCRAVSVGASLCSVAMLLGTTFSAYLSFATLRKKMGDVDEEVAHLPADLRASVER